LLNDLLTLRKLLKSVVLAGKLATLLQKVLDPSYTESAA